MREATGCIAPLPLYEGPERSPETRHPKTGQHEELSATGIDVDLEAHLEDETRGEPIEGLVCNDEE